MTFLILTRIPQQGRALSEELERALPGCLCLVMTPEEGTSALREVQVDAVISQEKLPPSVETRPRFVFWPEAMAQAQIQDLIAELKSSK